MFVHAALADTTKKKAVQSMKENLHKAAILNNKLENQTEENSIINSKRMLSMPMHTIAIIIVFLDQRLNFS